MVNEFHLIYRGNSNRPVFVKLEIVTDILNGWPYLCLKYIYVNIFIYIHIKFEKKIIASPLTPRNPIQKRNRFPMF
ncbi:unnamed protein product [Schistosoma mattheei]|uniref:Uncharacterized protein n=1 Tax=Schistosoma mattheei TaxID=31246 RepID=A0A183Q3Y9_9TREM|nr:unnamed protein product [Schistosoma mattheei]